MQKNVCTNYYTYNTIQITKKYLFKYQILFEKNIKNMYNRNRWCTLKKILIKLIELYQSSPLSSHSYCRYIPTCSEYMKIAINKYGCFKGTLLGIKRILKCNPIGGYGYDPVPDKKEDV